MIKLNKILTTEEQKELSCDYEQMGLHNERNYLRGDSYLPEYIKEAMRKNGVIRTADGKFVKIRS